MTVPSPSELEKLVELFRSYWGDYLLQVNLHPPNQISLLVETDQFADGAAFIYNHLLLKARYLTLLALDEDSQFSVYLLLFLKEPGVLLSISTLLNKDRPTYPALSPNLPPATWHERELHDLFGITAEGVPLPPLVLHPGWPRGHHYPMRSEFPENEVIPIQDHPLVFEFHEAPGRHQVAVGPIHAGIIEPGHLRFSVTGEQIHQFEAQLFYTHKGIEKMAEHKPYQTVLNLAEHVCGLCAFSHSLAFTQALESLGQIPLPDRALAIRAILLEMERLASHFADLSAICSAGGFGFGTARAAYFREIVVRVNEILTGHRFLRGINTVGGLQRDISEVQLTEARQQLTLLQPQFEAWQALVLQTDSFLDRVEETGYLSLETARQLGLVGPSARGSGIDEDMRRDFPYGVHTKLSVPIATVEGGDALARMNVRLIEVNHSLALIHELIASLPKGPIGAAEPFTFPMFQPAIGLVESAKGNLLHWVMMGQNHHVYRWHVRSASYMNWPGMVQATMGNNIVPDGPLVNKSFNLCYACVDR